MFSGTTIAAVAAIAVIYRNSDTTLCTGQHSKVLIAIATENYSSQRVKVTQESCI